MNTMKIDGNKTINDLWHVAFNNFKFLENLSAHNNKKLQHYLYINKVNENAHIEAIVTTPWLFSKIFDSELETSIKLSIVIDSQKFWYSKEFRIKYESLHTNDIKKIDWFREFFNTFKENIRLFNWDVLEITPKWENEKMRKYKFS